MINPVVKASTIVFISLKREHKFEYTLIKLDEQLKTYFTDIIEIK